ncbi:MAG: YdcH family protein [Rhodobacteraceae bacterium]|nr:YdcH family protein [Paracoccaceae bacterium]
MSHTPHELADDFPGQTDKIHALKTANAHFARLMDEYHEINREVHRAETNVEPVDQMAETEMRKKRMALKDEIARMLAQA